MRGSRPPSFTIKSLLSARRVRFLVITLGSIRNERRTVDSQVAQSSASCPLYLRVVTAEEEEDGIEGVAADVSHFFLCDFCKGQCGASLKVDIV